MTPSGIQEAPHEDLTSTFLTYFLQELQEGVIRRPDNFNDAHFLLFLLYDSHGYLRDRYPLWRWYHRIKKKYLTSKHINMDTDNSRQCILTVFEQWMDTNANSSASLAEAVRIEEQFLHSSVHGLFQFYTPLHTYLYMERVDRPILNDNPKLFQLFQSAVLESYASDSCDLIHFAIAHRNTSLLKKIFGEKIHWLDQSMQLVTVRGWLPLHYAAYVGDKESVRFSSRPAFSIAALAFR